MKDKVLLSTLVATITATALILFVKFLLGKQVDWQSIVIYMLVFAVVFNITGRLRQRKK